MEENKIIDTLLGKLESPKRDTKRNEDTKAYKKLTISITQKEKYKIMDFAKENNISVSKLIKDLLRDNNIIE